VGEDDVIDRHDRVEARRLGDLHHADGIREVGKGVVAEVEREFHATRSIAWAGP